MKFDFDEKGKVLGINWDEVGDLLIIRFEDILKKAPCSKFTKRGILRVIASFYDPLGWIQLVIVQLKIIFQNICKLKVEWDEQIPAHLEAECCKIMEEIKRLKQVVIPRCYRFSEICNPILRTE